jgi:hypothetical protein
MELKLFQLLVLKFECQNWVRNPEFGVLDTILEVHSESCNIVEADVREREKESDLGCDDSPSAEQIVHVALYKEHGEGGMF